MVGGTIGGSKGGAKKGLTVAKGNWEIAWVTDGAGKSGDEGFNRLNR